MSVCERVFGYLSEGTLLNVSVAVRETREGFYQGGSIKSRVIETVKFSPSSTDHHDHHEQLIVTQIYVCTQVASRSCINLHSGETGSQVKSCRY